MTDKTNRPAPHTTGHTTGRTGDHTGDHTGDVLDLVRRHEPAMLEEWNELDQQRVLARILDVDRPAPQRRGRARWAGLGLLATAAAAVPLVASIGLPTSAPGGPTQAAALDRLAVIAGVTGVTVGPGQYLHTQEENEGPYRAGDPLAPGEVRNGDRVQSGDETWTGQNRFWVRSEDQNAQPCLETFPLTGTVTDNGYDTASADELATLPTKPDALATYLDEHPDGGNRGTLNRYVAVTDLLWSGLASPQLRSAALNVLAQTPGLTGDEHTTDDRGRPAIRIDYRGGDDTESVWFDPVTAQIVERAYGPRGDDASSVVTSREVIGQLPTLPSCPRVQPG